MAKVKARGEVIFKVSVEVEVEHTLTDKQIEEIMLDEAIEQFKYNAESEVEIDYVEDPDEWEIVEGGK